MTTPSSSDKEAKKESRLLVNLKLNKFKLKALLDMTKAINNKLTTSQLLEIYQRIVHEELEIPKLILFAKSTDHWSVLLEKGEDEGRVQVNPDKDFKDYQDITVVGNLELDSLKGYDILIPVFHNERPLAYLMIGDLDEDSRKMSPSIKHMNFIQTLTNILVVAIENKRLAKENLEQARLKREVELAAEMQSFLVPTDFHSNELVDMSGLYLPHQEVGGDYYDYIPLDNDRFVFCIADVSGKGIAAAFLMANFQAYLKSHVATTNSLDRLIKMLNKRVFESSRGDRFITFFIGLCDFKNNKMTYVNAGHNPPVFQENGVINTLNDGCVGLGMLEEIDNITVGTTSLQKGDTLICFTDGLVEMENIQKEEYGTNRIMTALQSQSFENMTEFNEYLFADFNDFCQSETPFDDIALLSFKVL